MAKAAYPTIGIAAFVMFGIVYFIGCLPYKDESLLRKAAKALKKLASQKSDETLMTENDFFVRIDEAKKQIKSGKCKKMLQNENLDDFLARNGYV